MSHLLIQMVPLDIANIILEYTGYHKRRNGQYMPQIVKTTKIYLTFVRRFNRTISHRRTANNAYGYIILKVSPTTQYAIFNSHAVSNGRL
jgi:hypothetical protein